MLQILVAKSGEHPPALCIVPVYVQLLLWQIKHRERLETKKQITIFHTHMNCIASSKSVKATLDVSRLL